ncbi:MAG: hypothetical protein K2L24_02755 [Opitutales bacterium]|nr:hypothetical protein [Opitutales bacterium]
MGFEVNGRNVSAWQVAKLLVAKKILDGDKIGPFEVLKQLGNARKLIKGEDVRRMRRDDLDEYGRRGAFVIQPRKFFGSKILFSEQEYKNIKRYDENPEGINRNEENQHSGYPCPGFVDFANYTDSARHDPSINAEFESPYANPYVNSSVSDLFNLPVNDPFDQLDDDFVPQKGYIEQMKAASQKGKLMGSKADNVSLPLEDVEDFFDEMANRLSKEPDDGVSNSADVSGKDSVMIDGSPGR